MKKNLLYEAFSTITDLKPYLSCDYTYCRNIHNIRYFLINMFLRRKTVENALCDSLTVVNSSTIILSLFVSTTIDISSNSTNLSDIKKVILSPCNLRNFLHT